MERRRRTWFREWRKKPLKNNSHLIKINTESTFEEGIQAKRHKVTQHQLCEYKLLSARALRK